MSDDERDERDEQNEKSTAQGGQEHGGPSTGHEGSDEAVNNPGTQGSGRQDDSAVKDPKDWKTGDEPATAAQKSYISTMAVEAHEEVPFELTKAEASEKIEELQQKTGRTGDNLAPQ